MAGDWTRDDLAGVLAAFAANVTALVPRRCSGCAGCTSRAWPAIERNTPDRRRAQHLAALRPLERAVRAVPGRDDDVLVRRVRARRHARTGPARASTTALRELVELRARRSPARDRQRLGRHGDARRRDPRLPGHHLDALARAGELARAARRGGRPRRPGRGRCCATTASSRAATTRSSRSRCSRPSARSTGRRSSRAATGCWHRAARSACRRSRCRTAGIWRTRRRVHLDPEVHLPGRADPLAGGDRRGDARPVALRVDRRREIGPHYARTLRRWRERFLDAARRGARARLRPTRSCGCGSSTWPTARPGSRPARSAMSSCCWRGH